MINLIHLNHCSILLHILNTFVIYIQNYYYYLRICTGDITFEYKTVKYITTNNPINNIKQIQQPFIVCPIYQNN